MELKGVVDFQSTIATSFADDGVFNRLAGARHIVTRVEPKSAFEMLDSDGNERVTKGEFVENLIIELALSERMRGVQRVLCYGESRLAGAAAA